MDFESKGKYSISSFYNSSYSSTLRSSDGRLVDFMQAKLRWILTKFQQLITSKQGKSNMVTDEIQKRL